MFLFRPPSFFLILSFSNFTLDLYHLNLISSQIEMSISIPSTMPCPMNVSKEDIELIQLLQYGKVPYTRGLLDMQKERQRDFLTLKRNCKMSELEYWF